MGGWASVWKYVRRVLAVMPRSIDVHISLSCDKAMRLLVV